MNGTNNATCLNSTALAVAYSFVVLVGLPLNALSLWIIVCRHRLRAANTVIMANLAVSDFLLILSLPIRIALYVDPSDFLKGTPCQLTTYLLRINILSSAFFITFISVDRLLALVYPLRSRVVRTPRTSVIACTAVWLLAMTYSVYDMFYKPPYSCIPAISCKSPDLNITAEDPLSPPVFAVILSVCLPLLFVVNLLCTASVLRSLSNRQTDLAGYNVRKVMLIYLVNMLIFALFLPFIIALLWNVRPERQPEMAVIEVTLCLSTFNCCLDPLVYYFALDGFWKKKQSRVDA